MADKHLSELEWKKFSKGRDLKEAPLAKALGALEAAARANAPDKELSALDEIEKQVEVLRKAAKNDKEVLAYLSEVDKETPKQRKMSEAALKKAQQSEDEEEESPVLLTSKMVPLVRSVKKGETVQVMIANTGKEVAVLMSRRAISPGRRKLLTEYLGASGTPKIILGECVFEENAYTFVVQSQASGLAKKLKAALLKQTELRLKVRVRGDDPNDVDDDGEPAEDEEGGETQAQEQPQSQPQTQPQPQPQTQAPQQGTAEGGDPLAKEFEQRFTKLEPRLLEALRARGADAGKLRAVADFSQGKAEAGQYKAALQGLDSLVKLLDAIPAPTAASTAAPSTEPTKAAAPEQDAPGADPMAAFKTRLAGLLGALKPAIEAGRDGVAEQRARVAEAGALAQKRNFADANAQLERVEAWLAEAPVKASGMVALQKSRLAWDGLRKSVQSQLQGLEASVRAAVLAHNADESSEEEFEEGPLGEGVKRLYKVLDGLDDGLIDKLDEALNAEGAQRAGLQGEAAALIKKYQAFVDSDPMIATIDNNGFIATTIRQESNKTLADLAAQL